MNIIQVIIAAVVAVVFSFFGGKMLGVQQGRNQVIQDMAVAKAEAFVKKEAINNEVNSLDKYSKCIELGGMRDDCRRLSGVAKTP